MMYAAADFILRPMVLAFLLLTAATMGLAWHGTFSRSGGGHSAPRRTLDWEGTETVPRAIDGPREETLVSAGHSANWEPNTLGLVLDAKRAELAPVFTANGIPGYDPAAVTVVNDPPGRHEAPRIHAFAPGGDPYCSKCGTSGHWRGDESCEDAVVTELLVRRRETSASAAIAADLEAAGFRYHDDSDDAVKSMFTRAMAMTVRAIEAP